MIKPRLVLVGLVSALLAVACGAAEAEPALTPSALVAPPTVAADGTAADGTVVEADPIDDLDSVAFTPGQVSHSAVVIDGTRFEYATLVPEGFDLGDTAPVLVALPPGNQNIELTLTLMAETYGRPALDNGWVVVSPAAPEGQLWVTGAETLMPEFLDWINGWVTPEGGKPHLIGVSNGGVSAFRIAGQQPEAFQSLTVFPGFPNSTADLDALAALGDIPIRMYVGERDEVWRGAMEQTVELLAEQEADARLEIIANEGHFIQSLADGVRLFEELEVLRQDG